MKSAVIWITGLVCATAQAKPLDLEHFNPAGTDAGLLTVKSGGAEGSGAQSLGATFVYTHGQLYVTDAAGARLAPLVEHRLGLVLTYALGLDAELTEKLGLVGGVDLVASVPTVPLSYGRTLDDRVLPDEPSVSGGLGDPRLEARVTILTRERFGVDVALVPVLSLPLAAGGGYLGNGSFVFTPEAAVSTVLGPLWVGANLGYRLRGNKRVEGKEIADQLLWRAGAGVELDRFGAPKHLRVSVEAYGLAKAVRPFSSAVQSPTELLVGGRQRISDFVVSAGFGTGLNRGYGTPAARAILGLMWAPRVFDRDGDGVPDESDRCPDAREDADAYDDDDGCPDPDNDGDGLLDDADACPDAAEDVDGFEDVDGCPDLDNDRDGIPDSSDRCPNELEDKDGFEDDDGCPDLDNDGDGVLDVTDRCPDEPEDKDGFQDHDGCPDLDNDGDGFADEVDKCPLLAEDLNNYKDEDGCPDAKDDKDGDGIADKLDKCPTEPEDRDGFEDEDGCPDLDNDGDGVPDTSDACPAEPEDKDGFMDEDGCPEEDNDGDGIVDGLDKCPDEAEVINGVEDGDGCPDEGAQLVTLTATAIEIRETVQFETNSDVIRSESFDLLEQVASVVRNHRHITRLRIEGHTDDRGADEYNLELSQKRADAVMRFLIDKGGIEAERLEAMGHGEQRPIASNKSERGRAMNRRVEFHIAEPNSQPPAEPPVQE